MIEVSTVFPDRNFGAVAFERDERMISPAYRSVAVGEFLFGRDAPTSAFNVAVPGQRGTLIGDPVFGARYAELGVDGYLETGVPDQAELTIIAVMRFIALGGAWLCTQYGLGSSPFTDFDISAYTVRGITANASGPNSEASVDATARDTAWQTVAMRVTSGTGYTTKLDVFRAGARLGGTSVTSSATRGVGAGQFAVGSAHGTQDVGVFALAGITILNTVPSDAALHAEAVAIGARMAAWGIAT